MPVSVPSYLNLPSAYNKFPFPLKMLLKAFVALIDSFIRVRVLESEREDIEAVFKFIVAVWVDSL